MGNFPVSQDTWARKTDRNLAIGELGDDIMAQDYTDFAQWLEDFQNILGYNILGVYGTLVERLDDTPTTSVSLVFSMIGGLE